MPEHIANPPPSDNLAKECSAIAMELYRLAVEQSRLRAPLEDRWFLDTLQYYGLYDPETQQRLDRDQERSKLYVNQTRPKVRVMRARLVDILVPNDDTNWDIEPTPEPDIEILTGDFPDKGNMPLAAREADRARSSREEARKKAQGMRRRMADQLTECGYPEITRKIIDQGVKLGAGVCKGPYADWRRRHKWGKKGKDWIATEMADDRPAFEWVDLWDFYPDMAAGNVADCEFIFQLHRFSARDLRRLSRRGDFNEDAIRAVLLNNPDDPGYGEFSRHVEDLRIIDRAYEDRGKNNRYTVLEYHGPIPYDSFASLCKAYEQGHLLDATTNPDDPLKAVDGVVWFCQDQILKFGLSPTESDKPTYSVFRLDPSDSTLFGFGIPSMLRDPQKAINAGFRALMDNAGLAGVPMYVVNKDLLEPQTDGFAIKPRKVWFRIPGEGVPVESIQIEGNSEKLIEVIKLAKQFADDETNLPPVAQGDPGTGARQTAHGMTLLVNAVNIIFKNAGRSFDSDVTLPNIIRLYEWNMEHLTDDSIKGDMRCKALGSSVLLMREIQAQNALMLINLAATNPVIEQAIHLPRVIRTFLKAIQADQRELGKTDEEIQAAQIQSEEAAKTAPNPDLESKLAVEQARGQTQLQIAQLNMNAEILKLASSEKRTIDQIAADLEKAQLQISGKRDLMVAELGFKEKFGTGI